MNTSTYTWDSENRMKAMVANDGFELVDTMASCYTADGQRVWVACDRAR